MLRQAVVSHPYIFPAIIFLQRQPFFGTYADSGERFAIWFRHHELKVCGPGAPVTVLPRNKTGYWLFIGKWDQFDGCIGNYCSWCQAYI